MSEEEWGNECGSQHCGASRSAWIGWVSRPSRRSGEHVQEYGTSHFVSEFLKGMVSGSSLPIPLE